MSESHERTNTQKSNEKSTCGYFREWIIHFSISEHNPNVKMNTVIEFIPFSQNVFILLALLELHSITNIVCIMTYVEVKGVMRRDQDTAVSGAFWKLKKIAQKYLWGESIGEKAKWESSERVREKWTKLKEFSGMKGDPDHPSVKW